MTTERSHRIRTSARMGVATLALAASVMTMLGGPAAAEKPSPKKPPTTSTTVPSGPYLEYTLENVLVSSWQL